MEGGGAPLEADERPIIDATPGEPDRVLRETVAALFAYGAEIYDRGGLLVRPRVIEGSEPAIAGVTRSPGAIVTQVLTAPWLVHEMAGSARYVRLDRRTCR